MLWFVSRSRANFCDRIFPYLLWFAISAEGREYWFPSSELAHLFYICLSWSPFSHTFNILFLGPWRLIVFMCVWAYVAGCREISPSLALNQVRISYIFIVYISLCLYLWHFLLCECRLCMLYFHFFLLSRRSIGEGKPLFALIYFIYFPLCSSLKKFIVSVENGLWGMENGLGEGRGSDRRPDLIPSIL